MLDSNDDNSLKTESKETNRNPILLIGIGSVAWIGIGSVAFLFKITLRDVFLNIGIPPNYTEIFTSLVDFLTYVIGFIILVKVIKSGKYSDWNIFKLSILLLIIGQVLQFIEPMMNSKLRTEKYLKNSSQYYDFLKENLEYYSVSIVGSVLIWIIVVLIIYLNKNNSG